MVVGGYGADSHVEIIDLENENFECFQPAACLLKSESVGTFLNGAPLVCEDDISNGCYVYEAALGSLWPYLNYNKQDNYYSMV